ncbi:MAG: hypothetical protein JWM53_620 [bacterium]|nr:hypothetical protein [bacterium]
MSAMALHTEPADVLSDVQAVLRHSLRERVAQLLVDEEDGLAQARPSGSERVAH